MRLGGPVYVQEMTPEKWVQALKNAGYSAAYCPVDKNTPTSLVQSYVKAAKSADIIIAEVGAWSNPLSPDEEVRNAALKKCQEQLALADEVGARCCVNISGSRGEIWDGPYKDNLTAETFDMIVLQTQAIIDAVHPKQAFFALEPMPWMYPDTADSYLALIKAIDRSRFGVHIDMVNVINSPQLYYSNAALIKEWFRKLGPHIVSCHAKDILISSRLTVHLEEVRPGLGEMDYSSYLTEISKLDPDMPLMIEHLHTVEEYQLSAEHIRSIAKKAGLHFI